MALNGRPSIFQMARLAEEIRARGGIPDDPTTYLGEYDDRLLRVVERTGSRDPRRPRAAGPVGGPRQSRPARRTFAAAGLKLYLASGTDLRFVRPEADLLELTPFFGAEIYAPDGDDTTFSKRDVIDRILAENGIRGEELLSFGDGVVGDGGGAAGRRDGGGGGERPGAGGRESTVEAGPPGAGRGRTSSIPDYAGQRTAC